MSANEYPKLIYKYAVRYAEIFHAVVPNGAWSFIGKEGKEISMWKVPLIKGWQEKPLTTEKAVSDFWQHQWLEYHNVPAIGIATGQICGGYIVIDLDVKPERGINGYEYLLKWQRETGMRLPEETWTAITGSGGYHLWFRTDAAMRPFANDEIGVDLRADGAQIVVPPSPHPSGNRYEWELSPGDCECAEADAAVMAFINHCRPSGSQFEGNKQYTGSTRRDEAGEREMHLPAEFPDGERHTKLISLIGTMNRLGAADETIEAAIRTENDIKCKPPLTEMELQKEIFPAIYRWAKGVSKDKWQNREDFLKQSNMLSRMQARVNRTR